MYLIDTNILIYAFLKKEPYSSLFIEWVGKKQLVLSIIPVCEFLVGASRQDAVRLDVLIENIGIQDIDYLVAKQAAEYRKQYKRKIKALYLLDCLLAATAKVYGHTLVTKNSKDFPMRDIKIINP
ncbi:MAG: PIN domain-containing protein [bacterium]|nr:PIN domain-containing protein [bacterium]